MGKAQTQEIVSGVAAPPPGYPTENPTVTVEKKKKKAWQDCAAALCVKNVAASRITDYAE
ncbi:hypothetical protein AKJ16_DCAP11042 [Drosera capensis]